LDLFALDVFALDLLALDLLALDLLALDLSDTINLMQPWLPAQCGALFRQYLLYICRMYAVFNRIGAIDDWILPRLPVVLSVSVLASNMTARC